MEILLSRGLEQQQLQMVDLWKNQTTRLFLVGMVCLVILALIVGIVSVVLFGGDRSDAISGGSAVTG